MKNRLETMSIFKITSKGFVYLSVCACTALAAPTGGVVTSGSASISNSGQTTTITQSTNKASINWNSFSVAKNESVNFVQPNTSSITLNRVIGNEKSIIDGSLRANGQVWLLNSNGVLFGKGSSVNVSGLVASTMNMSDKNFIDGNYKFESTGSMASVINMGTIDISNSGYAALLAKEVKNQGEIKALKGKVHLVGANEVSINLNGNSLVNLKVDKSVLDALVENKGAIYADGGEIYLTTSSADELLKGVVNNEGILQARTLDDIGGKIILFAHGGTANVSGYIDASAPNGGDGGFVETSGKTVNIDATTVINAGSKYGKGGEWLIDPYNYTIDAAAATTINMALNSGTNVTIDTSVDNAGFGSSGDNTGYGDILINSAISKTAGGDATLTLNAERDIVVNSGISSSAGKLNLNFYADTDLSQTGFIYINNVNVVTNGGNIVFGQGNKIPINGVNTYVGGDVYIAGSVAQTISTSGGNMTVNGEMLLANSNGITFNMGSGNAVFNSTVNSANTYSYNSFSNPSAFWNSADTSTWTWSNANSAATAGTGTNVGDSYLTTITSRLENMLASRVANYVVSWIGAKRLSSDLSKWIWVGGPEANTVFYRNDSPAGVLSSGMYANWSPGEPNGNPATGFESYGEFVGTQGKWNDVPNDSYFWVGRPDVNVVGYVKETNTAGTALNITAGNVTFNADVGAKKALGALTVNATTTTLNANTIKTDGSQTYNTNLVAGAASTTLESVGANTNISLSSGKNITSDFAGDTTLTLKTTGNIILNTSSSISDTSNKLNTVLWADSDGDSNGAISVSGSTISTNDGSLWMGGGSGSTTWNSLTVGNGSATGNSTYNSGILLDNSTINVSAGSVKMTGKGYGSGGSGVVLVNNTAVTSSSGSIVMNGTGDGSAGSGVYINSSSVKTTAGGGIGLTGTGSTSATVTNNNEGVKLDNSSLVEVAGGNGDLTVNGTGGNGVNWNIGVNVRVNSIMRMASTATGTMNIVGNGGNCSGGGCWGVLIEGGTYESLGGASIIFDTTGGTGTNNYGFWSNGGNIGNNSMTGNITVITDRISLASGTSFKGTGALTIKPKTSATTIGIGGGAGTLSLSSTYFNSYFSNTLSSIVVGDSAQTGDISIGSVVTRSNLTLNTQGNVTQTGAITGNKNLNLLGSGGSYVLANTGNDIATLSANTGSVNFVDSNALTVASVTGSGQINIATQSGDITINGAISTSDTSSSAITVNAGKNSAFSTVSGGNITVSGGSVSTGAGGRATMYSGSISDSTGLATLVGVGSGNFRYGSDESTTNYTLALGGGKYAIYREQPTIYVAPSSLSTVLGSPIDVSGVTGSLSGYVNGDTFATSNIAGTATFATAATGASSAGSYNIAYTGGLTNKVGYSIADNATSASEHTITPAPTPTPTQIPVSAPTPTPTPTQITTPIPKKTVDLSQTLAPVANNIAIVTKMPTTAFNTPVVSQITKASSVDATKYLISSPSNEATTKVTTKEAKEILGQSTDLRVPLSAANSTVELINGGVKLPIGVEQEFYMTDFRR